MEILIDDDFNAKKIGIELIANIDIGEFVLDTNKTNQFSIGLLKDIALTNRINVPGLAEYRDILNLIENGIIEMVEIEQEKETLNKKIDDIVAQGIEQDKEDDSILIELVKAGVSFKNSMRRFAESLERQGLRTSLKDVKEKGRAMLIEQEFEPDDYDKCMRAATVIRDNIEGCDIVQALKAVKAYCKELDFEFPKAPRTPKGTLMSRVFAHIVSNPSIDSDGLKQYLSEKEGSGDEKQVKRYSAFLEFAQNFAAATIEAQVSEVDSEAA